MLTPKHSIYHSVLLQIGTQIGQETQLSPKDTDGYVRPERAGLTKVNLRNKGRLCGYDAGVTKIPRLRERRERVLCQH